MSAVAENIQTQRALEEPPAPIIFTDSAAGKVKELVDEEGNPDLKAAAVPASSTASPSTKSSTRTTPRCRRTASRC
jgi:hypothetical protein